MLSGRRQAVDGFFIKANASMDSLVEREILEDAETFRQELTANEDKEESVTLRIENNDYQEVNQIKPKKNFVGVIPGESVDSIENINTEQPPTPSPLNVAALNDQAGYSADIDHLIPG